jgi:quinol monooxygenase YgiN
MLIQSIHFTFAPEDADNAEDLLRELQAESRKEDGVIRFDVGRSEERPTVFALWEVYRDRTALESHVATDHFQRLVVQGVRTMAKRRDAETVFPLS